MGSVSILVPTVLLRRWEPQLIAFNTFLTINASVNLTRTSDVYWSHIEYHRVLT